MAVDEPITGSRAELFANPTFRLALLIAVGIGLHNFSEGLAIGQSAAGGELGLAVLLVIGFALHNATEGFGITAPFAAAQVRPSWAVLGLLALIGGGPTFVGTLIGQAFTNDAVSILFLALAAGSILVRGDRADRGGVANGCQALPVLGADHRPGGRLRY